MALLGRKYCFRVKNFGYGVLASMMHIHQEHRSDHRDRVEARDDARHERRDTQREIHEQHRDEHRERVDDRKDAKRERRDAR
jgi:hypothetical protein